MWIIHSAFLRRRLSQNQSCYREFFDSSPFALIVVGNDYRILEWNETAEAIFGWNHYKPHGEDIVDLIATDLDRHHFLESLRKTLYEGFSQSRNYHFNQHGHEIVCEWQNRLLDEKEGKMLCMAQDITKVQKTMDELNKRSMALESAGDAIFYTDEKGVIEFANQSFFALGLENRDRIYGTHIGTYLFNNRLTFSSLRPEFEKKRLWKGTVTKNSEAGPKVFSITITAVFHHDRLVSYIANLHDITTISSHVDALTHRSQHDPLTGATNRATMNERLDLAIRHADEHDSLLALFFIDLNDFKTVNDRYGHEAGDRLLIEVAANLRACLRNTDIISRYGGDEFVVIVENIKSDEHIHAIHETIAAAISEPIVLEGGIILHPKASVGIARYPTDAQNSVSLIKAADQAMYTQKKFKSLSAPVPALYADSHNR